MIGCPIVAGSVTAPVCVAFLLGATVLDDSCFLIFVAALAGLALLGLIVTRLLAATDPRRRRLTRGPAG